MIVCHTGVYVQFFWNPAPTPTSHCLLQMVNIFLRIAHSFARNCIKYLQILKFHISHLPVQSININFVWSDIYHQVDSNRYVKVVENGAQLISACGMFLYK